MFKRFLFLLSFILVPNLALAQTHSPFEVLLDPPTIFLQPGASALVNAKIVVPEGHYLYKDSVELNFTFKDDLLIQEVIFPESTAKQDPFLGKTVQIFPTDADIQIKINAPKDAPTRSRFLTANVAFQGCSSEICYRREIRGITWPALVNEKISDDITNVPQATVGIAKPTYSTDASLFARLKNALQHPDFVSLASQGRGLTYLLAFIGGLLTCFTPCVLPLIPIVLLIVGVKPGNKTQNFELSASLALGIATTTSVAGLVAGLAGLPLALLFQQKWFLILAIIFFVTMALSMFGLFTLELPERWQLALQKVGGRGFKGAYLAGISTGLLATPCAGPVVAGLVTFVGIENNLWFAFSLLLVYGLGFGFVFMIVGTFYGNLARKLPHGRFLQLAKILLGILLLIPAIYYSWVLFGTTTSGPWMSNQVSAFERARTENKPVLMEFTAKSCPPCLLMEKTTFADEDVLSALAKKVVPLRIDMTFPDEASLELAEHYGIVGWPALVFVNSDGTEMSGLKMVGKVVSAEDLLHQIETAITQSK